MAPPLITPRQSWLEKLKDGVSHASPQVKQALIGGAVTTGLALVTGVGSWWLFAAENSRLKSENHRLESELASLRHENQILVAENNRWRLLMDPIERKAKEIYPELETSAAVAKLAKDLEDVRNLATRAEFKPLSTELKKQIVAVLNKVQQPQGGEKIQFLIGYEHGSEGRAKLAEELSNVLKESGVLAVFEGPAKYVSIGQNFETPVRVFMNLEGPAQNVYRQVAQPLSRLITSGVVPLGNPNTATNEIHIQIMGTPAFLPDGSVLFQ